MKPRVILGILGIALFTSLLFFNLGNSISSYVGFEEAARMQSKNVHVVGEWDKEKASGFSMESKTFSFWMKDEAGKSHKVIYPKPKPNNFDAADRLVVIGSMQNGVFYADEMLMKCPSKYNDARADQFLPSEES